MQEITVETIDLTPTWEQATKMLLMLFESGNQEGRATAISELLRMAKLADLYVSQEKGK